MQKIKSGDTVEVITGKDRGIRGEVLRVIPTKERVVVERVNVVKKHQRPQANTKQAGIIEFEAPIHWSNVMLVCPQCDKCTRIGFRFTESGTKVRHCKKCGEDID